MATNSVPCVSLIVLCSIAFSSKPSYAGKATLYEHENMGGAAREMGDNEDVPHLGDLDDKVTSVRIEGRGVWVVLYENQNAEGLAVVFNHDGSRNVPEWFNDRATSSRTVATEEPNWRSIVQAGKFVHDKDRVYDISATVQASAVADQIRESFCHGNKQKCHWEFLRVDLKSTEIHGRVFMLHRHKVAGNQLYSVETPLEFKYNYSNGQGDVTIEVPIKVAGKEVAKVKVKASEVVKLLSSAGLVSSP
jgi:hypothetical protein